jgi:hypothetical protein
VAFSSAAGIPCKETDMQKLLATTAGALAALALYGCEAMSTTPGLGEEADMADLSGMTLLGSDQAECEGVLQVDADQDADEDFDDGRFVESGQNATFELDDENENLPWACVGEDGDRASDTLECPDNATHVRITRADDGGEVLFECYGA